MPKKKQTKPDKYLKEMALVFGSPTTYKLIGSFSAKVPSAIKTKSLKNIIVQHRFVGIDGMWDQKSRLAFRGMVEWRGHAALSYLAYEVYKNEVSLRPFHDLAEELVDTKFYKDPKNIVTLVTATDGKDTINVGYVLWKTNNEGSVIKILDKFIVQEYCAGVRVPVSVVESTMISDIQNSLRSAKAIMVVHKQLASAVGTMIVEYNMVSQRKIIDLLVDRATEKYKSPNPRIVPDPKIASIKFDEFTIRSKEVGLEDDDSRRKFIRTQMNDWLRTNLWDACECRRIVQLVKSYDLETGKLVDAESSRGLSILSPLNNAFKKLPDETKDISKFLEIAEKKLPFSQYHDLVKFLGCIKGVRVKQTKEKHGK